MTLTEEREYVKMIAGKLGVELPNRWYLPMGKNCLVARLPPKNKTEGGLWLADTDQDLPPYGILIGAGLAARDVMADNLIEIGDVVRFGKYEGSAEEFEREARKMGKYILQLLIEGIKGSVEADRRADDYEIEVRDDDGREVRFWVPKKKTERKAS